MLVTSFGWAVGGARLRIPAVAPGIVPPGELEQPFPREGSARSGRSRARCAKPHKTLPRRHPATSLKAGFQYDDERASSRTSALLLGGYLSDSQIHSVALALRMAAIQQFNVGAPIIALDDIVTSYDADHRRRITVLQIATLGKGLR